MYMDIYHLGTETGLTIEAHAFRMQGATTHEIEAIASPDGEWEVVARIINEWGAFITVNGDRYTQEVSDIDFSPEPSGLFPLLTLKETE